MRPPLDPLTRLDRALARERHTPTAQPRRVGFPARCDCGSGRDAWWVQTQADDWWDGDRVTADNFRIDCECEERS